MLHIDKRFIIKDIKSGVKFDRYENSFLWLKDCINLVPGIRGSRTR